MDLLIVPIVLALGAFLFNWSERRSEREISAKRDQTEGEIAGDRIRESALQTYLDRMTELLLEKNLRTSEPEAEVRAVARARTLTVLRDLDGERKGAVVRFLYESRLIRRGNVIVDLGNADLSGANLNWVDLEGSFLSMYDPRGANMSDADLRKVDLQGADLCGANLSWADLEGAKLSGVDFTGAIMPDGKKYDPANHVLPPAATPTPPLAP